MYSRIYVNSLSEKVLAVLSAAVVTLEDLTFLYFLVELYVYHTIALVRTENDKTS